MKCALPPLQDVHGQFYDLMHIFELNGLRGKNRATLEQIARRVKLERAEAVASAVRRALRVEMAFDKLTKAEHEILAAVKREGGIGTHITAITKRRFFPNLQRVKAVVNGEVRYIRVTASAIKQGLVVKPLKRIWKKPAAKAA